MPDQEIQTLAGDGLEPTSEFVDRLRRSVVTEWTGSTALPARRRQAARRAYVSLVAVAAVALAVAWWAASGTRTNRSLGPADTPPSSSVFPTVPSRSPDSSLGRSLPGVLIGSNLRLLDGVFFRLNPGGHFIVSAIQGTCIVVGDYSITAHLVQFSSPQVTTSNCPASVVGTGSWVQRMVTAGGEFTYTPFEGGAPTLGLRMADTGEVMPIAAVQL